MKENEVSEEKKEKECDKSPDGKHHWYRVIWGPHDEAWYCEYCKKEE